MLPRPCHHGRQHMLAVLGSESPRCSGFDLDIQQRRIKGEFIDIGPSTETQLVVETLIKHSQGGHGCAVLLSLGQLARGQFLGE